MLSAWQHCASLAREIVSQREKSEPQLRVHLRISGSGEAEGRAAAGSEVSYALDEYVSEIHIGGAKLTAVR